MAQSAKVLAFFRPANKSGDWTQEELAEFYRVEGALQQAGISVVTDRGISDQGEPWFVFCREDSEEIIAHFARIGGEYVIVSNLAPGMARGRDFTALIRNMLSAHPFVFAKAAARHQNIYLHPAALLAALVATAFMNSVDSNGESHPTSQNAEDKGSWWSVARHEMAVLSAIAISALVGEDHQDLSDKKSVDLALLQDSSADSSHTIHAASLDHNQMPDDGVGGGGGGTGAGGNAGDGGGQGVILGLLGAQIFDSQTANADDGQCSANSGAAPVLPGQEAAHQSGVAGTEPVGSVPAHATLDKGNLGLSGDNCLDQSFIVLTQSNSQLTPVSNNEKGQAVATTSSGDVVQSGAPDSSSAGSGHAVANSTPDVVNAMNAVQQAFGDLHIGSSAIQSVALPVASLPDAVQYSLADIFGQGSSNATSGPASGPAEPSTHASPSSEVSPFTPVSISPPSISPPSISALPPSFNQEAQSVIDAFFLATPAVKIETFGSSVLIEDTNASHFVPGHYGIETWQLQDGSTISILGVMPHSATA